jgi:hypothetical protein
MQVRSDEAMPAMQGRQGHVRDAQCNPRSSGSSVDVLMTLVGSPL